MLLSLKWVKTGVSWSKTKALWELELSSTLGKISVHLVEAAWTSPSGQKAASTEAAGAWLPVKKLVSISKARIFPAKPSLMIHLKHTHHKHFFKQKHGYYKSLCHSPIVRVVMALTFPAIHPRASIYSQLLSTFLFLYLFIFQLYIHTNKLIRLRNGWVGVKHATSRSEKLVGHVDNGATKSIGGQIYIWRVCMRVCESNWLQIMIVKMSMLICWY